jgi:hypothetical protein
MTTSDNDDNRIGRGERYSLTTLPRILLAPPAQMGCHHRHLSSSLSLIAAEVNSDANISLEFFGGEERPELGTTPFLPATARLVSFWGPIVVQISPASLCFPAAIRGI